jgi:hypothetical protein
MKDYVYVLEYRRAGFQQNCFKIGITDNPDKRLKTHESTLDGWTATVKFYYSLLADPKQAGIIENHLTLYYMAAYGFQDVRGSLYDAPYQAGRVVKGQINNDKRYKRWVLDAYRHVAATFERCYSCHEDHFSNSCRNRMFFNTNEEKFFLKNGLKNIDRVPPLSWFTHDRTESNRKIKRIKRLLEWTMNDTKMNRSENEHYSLRNIKI